MKIHKMTFVITLMVAILLILASTLIIRCNPAPEATSAPTTDSEAASSTASTTAPLGKDEDSFAQRVNPKQHDNAASCQECDLRAASLVEANLKGADLSGANLWQANLKWANLASANLTEADLEDALLEGANLSGADLSGAKLFLANLSGADLSGANFNKADLFGAHLDGVIGADFSGALNVPEYTKGLKMVGP